MQQAPLMIKFTLGQDVKIGVKKMEEVNQNRIVPCRTRTRSLVRRLASR